MSTNINRHQAGATVAGEKTGGQFKQKSRTAPSGFALGGSGGGECPTHGNEPMYRSPERAVLDGDQCTCPVAEVSYIEAEPRTLEWVERDVLLTPRHRKPQDISREAEVAPEFRHVSMEDTGEAFTVEPKGYEAEDGVPPKEYRHFDGDLYTPLRLTDVQACRGSEQAHEHLDANPSRLANIATRSHVYSAHDYGSAEELREAVQRSADKYLVIDGKMWQKTAEPVYTVSTFGLGGNHGGTGLMVSEPRNPLSHDRRIRDDNTFTLDEFEEAKAHALKVALGRGDTKSVALIEKQAPVATVSPTRPWKHPVPPKRLTGFTRPHEIGWEMRDDYATYKKALRDLKVKIAQEAPEALYTDDEGRGRVDFTLLTEGVQSDYAELVKRTHELRSPLEDEF